MVEKLPLLYKLISTGTREMTVTGTIAGTERYRTCNESDEIFYMIYLILLLTVSYCRVWYRTIVYIGQ